MPPTDLSFERLLALFEQTHGELQRRAARSVNLALVVRNWLFGWYIMEYEQNGSDRAEYGSRLLETLSERLEHKGIQGSSPTRLRLYRSFYQGYISSNSADSVGRIYLRTKSNSADTACAFGDTQCKRSGIA